MSEAELILVTTGPDGVDNSDLFGATADLAPLDDPKTVAVVALTVVRAADVVLNEVLALLHQVIVRERAEVGRGRAGALALRANAELGHDLPFVEVVTRL